MTWIKLTHVSGITNLNVDLIYRFEKNLTLNVTVYYLTGTSSTFTFASQTDRDESVSKLERILKVIDIDQLAAQNIG